MRIRHYANYLTFITPGHSIRTPWACYYFWLWNWSLEKSINILRISEILSVARTQTWGPHSGPQFSTRSSQTLTCMPVAWASGLKLGFLGPTHRESEAIHLAGPMHVHFSQASVDMPLPVSQASQGPCSYMLNCGHFLGKSLHQIRDSGRWRTTGLVGKSPWNRGPRKKTPHRGDLILTEQADALVPLCRSRRTRHKAKSATTAYRLVAQACK